MPFGFDVSFGMLAVADTTAPVRSGRRPEVAAAGRARRTGSRVASRYGTSSI